MAEPCALFVYGTLKRGQPNWWLLERHALSVEPATTRGLLCNLGPFPGLLEGDAGVRGDLVRLHPAALERVLDLVDELEGCVPDDAAASLYLRRPVEVMTESGSRERAYAYFYNCDGALSASLLQLVPIAAGEWQPAGAAMQRLPAAKGER